MPFTPGADVGTTIREFRTGSRYRKLRKKYGKGKAEQVALAAALRNRRARKKAKKKLRRSRKMTRKR